MDDKLLAVQKDIRAIKKDSTNPFFHSMYFDINAIIREVKPILNKHGLTVAQPTIYKDGKNLLCTQVCDGENVLLSSSLALPECTDVQKFGAAITYFRRFALQALLFLEAEDDDGNTASGKNEQMPVARPVNRFQALPQATQEAMRKTMPSAVKSLEKQIIPQGPEEPDRV